jgi:nucleoside-diphosphate-sugar epimerase
MGRLFIAGCGYIGTRVAIKAKAAGDDVTCLVRSEQKAVELEKQGFVVVRCSLDDAEEIPKLDISGQRLLYLVPPPGGGIYDQRARNFCEAVSRSGPPAKIIYMSATSVYSAKDGSVVTELSETAPVAAMGKRRLDAESVFKAYAAANVVPAVILRVSGIYGPGRLPLTQIYGGQPLLLENESGPSNRIHADDLTDICLAAVDKGDDGDIFNVSDGHPCSMTEYFNTVADALGSPRQPQVTLEEARKVMTPLMLSYVSDSRIVDSSKMFDRLGIKLRYPSMHDGINASVESRQ